MDQTTYVRARKDLNDACDLGTLAQQDSKDLLRFLACLCDRDRHGYQPNQQEIIQGISINSALMAKTLEALDAANKKTQRLVYILSIVTLVIGVIQAIAAVIACLN